MKRPPVIVVVAGAVAVVGLAGLIRGAVPLAAAGGGGTVSVPSAAPIVVTNAYVREPASPDVAAAYFTISNTTDTDDTLIGVDSGAGKTTALHNGSMAEMTGGLRIPAHSSVTLSPGDGHVMIQDLLGPLKPGQTVNLQLTFAHNIPLIVQAPVISINAPAPGASPPSGATK
jgi:periplasmic copper chaperone A